MKRYLAIILLLLVFLAILGRAAWLWLGPDISREKGPGFFMSLFEDSTPSTVLELQGNVEIREVRLGFAVPARISGMLVNEGDLVTTGQLVAELDPKYFQDAVNQTEGLLAARKASLLRLQNGSREEEIMQARFITQAARVSFLITQKELIRAKELLRTKSLTQEEFEKAEAENDRAEAQLNATIATQKLIETGPREEDIAQAQALVEQTQAQLDEAKRRVQDTRLFAPSDGVIQTRVHEPGDYVNIGEPVYTITLSEPVWIRTYLNEEDLGYVQPGMEVSVESDSGQTYKGQVGFISPVAEFTPKTVQTRDIRTDLVYRMRVVVKESKGQLRQGMPVSVRLPLPSHPE